MLDCNSSSPCDHILVVEMLPVGWFYIFWASSVPFCSLLLSIKHTAHFIFVHFRDLELTLVAFYSISILINYIDWWCTIFKWFYVYTEVLEQITRSRLNRFLCKVAWLTCTCISHPLKLCVNRIYLSNQCRMCRWWSCSNWNMNCCINYYIQRMNQPVPNVHMLVR